MTNPHALSEAAAVAWLEWSDEAFARADDEGKPVLLSITASWCHGCAVMDRASFAAPSIAATINQRFIPIRVDADRRPDINDRYNLDGWPTTAFLTPSGEILTGSTYLPPESLAALLEEVAQAYHSQRAILDARAASAAAARRQQARRLPVRVEPDLAAPQWLARRVVEECDPDYGGFGADGKFLHAPALRLALDEYARSGDAALASALTRTLDGMAAGAIHDHVEGGFFRYASVRDWTRPHTEKMLEDQLALAELYAGAARVLEQPQWQRVARVTIEYVLRTLCDRDQARFFASQAADESYYQVDSGSARRTLDAPVVDRTSFTDVTARAAATCLSLSTLLEDRALAELGGRALDQIVTATYVPGAGVAHWTAEQVGVRGLLADQVHAAWALLEVHRATANPTWSMLAEELMRTALRTMWDETHGGFYDRDMTAPGSIGLMTDPVKPLALNSLAARVLARLARLSGDPALQDRALDTLRSQTSAYREQGLFAAPYALAVADVLGPASTA
jgi:uncharacterized protein